MIVEYKGDKLSDNKSFKIRMQYSARVTHESRRVLSVRDWKRILSIASEELEINSRRKISLLE